MVFSCLTLRPEGHCETVSVMFEYLARASEGDHRKLVEGMKMLNLIADFYEPQSDADPAQNILVSLFANPSVCGNIHRFSLCSFQCRIKQRLKQR